jgi:hypothetical protein
MLYDSPVFTNTAAGWGKRRALRFVAITEEVRSSSAAALTDFAASSTSFLGVLTGVYGTFQRLLVEFVSGQVISLGVGCGGGFR